MPTHYFFLGSDLVNGNRHTMLMLDVNRACCGRHSTIASAHAGNSSVKNRCKLKANTTWPVQDVFELKMFYFKGKHGRLRNKEIRQQQSTTVTARTLVSLNVCLALCCSVPA